MMRRSLPPKYEDYEDHIHMYKEKVAVYLTVRQWYDLHGYPITINGLRMALLKVSDKLGLNLGFDSEGHSKVLYNIVEWLLGNGYIRYAIDEGFLGYVPKDDADVLVDERTTSVIRLAVTSLRQPPISYVRITDEPKRDEKQGKTERGGRRG